MSKKVNKFTKILLLIAMIFSDLMTPIKVLAAASTGPNEGDVGINNAISGDGSSVTVSAGAVRNEDGSLTNEGDVSVTKTVSKVVDEETNEVIEGRYNIEFNIKGKDITTTSSTPTPVYVVVVFDRSGSMEEFNYDKCIDYNWHGGCSEYEEVKFSAAKSGAQTFATTLLEKIPTANIALVTFATNVTVARDFSATNLDNASFGSPNGGTNLHAGLMKANELLSNEEVVPANANKYVVVISDGQPTYYVNSNGQNDSDGSGNSTSRNELVATLNEATDIKTKVVDEETVVEDAEIFAIGYSLPSGNVYDDTNNSSVPSDQKYGALTAEEILTMVATEDTAEDVENGVSHYINADPAAIVTAFTNIATEIGRTPAGTGATLTDTIGENFKLVAGETNTFYIDKILDTENGTTVSFEVEVDKSKITEEGWYNTNAGFILTYTDANGNSDAKVEYLPSQNQPQVWLTPEVYTYTVNYYKDSFDTTAIASDVREATNGTEINESNVQVDKYLNNSGLGTVGYEYNSIDPTSITIDGNGKIINVLYTIKKFSYVVNYYYDGNLENTNTFSNVNYGTLVESSSYYLDDADIREGYSLDTVNSDSDNFTITDNTVVIDIYYKKNSYGYTVNYYFNNNIDTDFTNEENALYGTVVEASEHYLDEVTLENKGNEDNTVYFINPIRPSNPSEITIGTVINENVINIYYVSTVVTNEDIEKTAGTDKIISGDNPITYTVNYTSVVNNVNEDDTVRVVITDTLPLEIYTEEENENVNLNGGVYDAASKTITWTFETTIEEFTEEFDASKTISYTVVYKNVGNGDGGDLINTVVGNTTAGGKTTVGVEDNSTVKVEIPGKVTAIYVDEADNTLADSETSNGLVGESYTTFAKDIFGYTLKETPDNATGVYTEEDILVEYVYTKNDGTIEETEVVKTATNGTVESIDSTFGYTITATGEVRDYVGDVTIKVVDNLPYELTEESADNLSDECVYDSASKTITCTRVITVTEEDYTNGVYNVNEVFNLELEFVGIDSEIVTNSAKVEVILDSNEKDEDDDTEETEVLKGTVVATYKDTEGNKLHEDVTTTDLAGTLYTTEEKTFFGYTLKEVTKDPEDAGNVYVANETIIVNYVYDKNDGTIEETEVVKTATNGTVDSIDSTFGYTITATGEVKDYVGDVTIKVVDSLPYELTEESVGNLSDECVYDSASKTITCTRVITITEEDYTNGVYNVNEVFNLELEYVGIDSEIVTNSAKVEITLDSNEKDEDDDTEETEVLKGTVVATYKDTDGNTLHEDVTTSDLAGTLYTTEIKEFYGYSLVEVPENKDGKYLANQTITVNYVYSKNPINITNNNVDKIGPDSVNSVNEVFNYTLKYTATIKEYTGKVTLKLTDTLPFDAVIVSSDNSCSYYDKTIVCEKEYDVDSDTTIDEVFNISLRYVGIKFDDINTNTTLTNSVKAELTYDDVTITNNDSKDTEIYKGTVVVTYKDTEGNTLHEDVTTSDLAGTLYTTEEKTFFGYTLVEVPSNKDGEYVANSTIVVNYVYDKNDGTIEETEVVKTATNGTVESVDSTFGYTITATGEVREYVGDVTIKVVDNLPYELTEESAGNLSDECVYDSASKTITCTRVITINENDYTNGVYNVNEVFNLELEFVGIDSETVTNSAKVEITLDSNEKDEDDDTEETEVLKGTVIATYKDTEGNTLHEDVTTNDLAGTLYTTEEKEFYGYTLVEIPSNKDGVYVANEIITVNYVYSKNVGTSEEELTKVGSEVVENIDSAFEYVIAYNTIIKDYAGEATLVITDELPYEIDTEKSVFGEACEYTDGKIVCTYSKDITEEDNSFVIEEELTLYYIDVTDSEVTNKVHSVLTYGNTTKEDDSEFTSEVKEGTVIVNYVTKDGTKLTDSITLTGMVGEEYTTDKKVFDKYNFIEVVGDAQGKYIDGTIEVTYVYDLTPLPPQTGVDMNLFMLIKYLVFAAIVVIGGKTYELIKNN